MSVAAAYSRPTFLGCSVRAFSSSIGWGVGSPSQLVVQLVEDPVNGDAWFVTDNYIGTPAYFQYGEFKFGGLIQSAVRKNDFGGNPAYEVVIVDPREILDGCQLIISGYSGPTTNVDNLLSPFGFWESIQFGGSFANAAGIPWIKIRDSVNYMTSDPDGTNFGGPLTYRGYKYSLDLTELPEPPLYYRLGESSNIGLLEAIAQIAEDGGCDFFITLEGFTIKVKTASRFNQPPLGTIGLITSSNYGGTLLRSTNGLEGRNEITSCFVVGGEVTAMYQTANITQFWGFDLDGNPLYGVPILANLVDHRGNVVSQFQTEAIALNAAPVSHILGDVYYYTTEFELRITKGGFETWASFMRGYRPLLAEAIGVTASFGDFSGLTNVFHNAKVDLVNDAPYDTLVKNFNAVTGDGAHLRAMQMYEFLKGYADEYLGKKYLVGLPFLLTHTDAETLEVTTSYEVTDAGYQEEGFGNPLEIDELNADFFRVPDGRFKAFVGFENAVGVDLSNVSPQGTAVQGTTLYMECQVDSQIVLTPAPAVVITLASVMQNAATQTVGDLNALAGVLKTDTTGAFSAMKTGYIDGLIPPAMRPPTAVAIPLKSNLYTYGPWSLQGAAGKVRFEHDESLTPWNYGGFSVMNLAGQARVANAITNMQVSETGTIEIAGAPTISLGEVLKAGGPNLTNCDVQVGVDGVLTSYRFATYTPRFGVFSKGSIDRMRRLSIVQQQLRRSVRNAIRQNIYKTKVFENARNARNWLANAPKTIKKNSPHDVMVSFIGEDPNTGAVRQVTQTATFEEALTLMNTDNGGYSNVAAMSLNGLFRPFSTGGVSSIPSLVEPENTGPVPSKTYLNPWRSYNDIDIVAHGSTFSGLNVYKYKNIEPENTRAIGLRGPLVIVGWGLDWKGNPVPGNDPSFWDSDYLYNVSKHKAGPLDVLWDERRGVWTCHDLVKGKLLTNKLDANGSGEMQVMCADGTTWNLTVYNFFSQAISGSNVKVQAGYFATDNMWYVISADCGSGNGGGSDPPVRPPIRL